MDVRMMVDHHVHHLFTVFVFIINKFPIQEQGYTVILKEVNLQGVMRDTVGQEMNYTGFVLETVLMHVMPVGQQNGLK